MSRPHQEELYFLGDDYTNFWSFWGSLCEMTKEMIGADEDGTKTIPLANNMMVAAYAAMRWRDLHGISKSMWDCNDSLANKRREVQKLREEVSELKKIRAKYNRMKRRLEKKGCAE